MQGRQGVGEKAEGPEAWGVKGCWTYRPGSKCVLGRAWALWCRDAGSESQVDIGDRCLSPVRAGTPLGGIRQAKQLLAGRSDPGH